MWEATSAYKSANQNPNSATPLIPPPPAPAPKPQPETPPKKRSTNPAVEQCVSAYYHALAAAGGPNGHGGRDAAEAAFKRALPMLSDRASILDFIACIAHGMVLNIFWKEQGPSLVVAAKAALAAIPREQQKSGPQPKEQEKS
jgi:hypothetical protein